MPNILDAVTQYGPKLELGPTVELAELAAWMNGMTGPGQDQAEIVLGKLGEAILHLCRQGQPVHLAGLGTFTPTINRIGEFAIEFSADLSLRNGMNAEGAYQGLVLNRESIGWTNEQYKEVWEKNRREGAAQE